MSRYRPVYPGHGCTCANPGETDPMCPFHGYDDDEVIGVCGRCAGHGTIVDIAAIAERLNVPKDTVNKWRHRGLLPEPDYPLSVGPVWEWQRIEAWAKETGRL